MAGYVGNVPVPQSVREDQSFTATAGQTTFNTLGYTDGNRIKVTLNGVLLEGGGVDYTATNGSDVVLTVAAVVDDIVRFETFNEVQLVSNTSTTPIIKTNLTLKNDTHEDTDGGRESTVIFSGEQSGGEITTLAEIEASHDGTADDQKGDLIFRTNDGNDNDAPTEAMRIDSLGRTSIGSGTSGVTTNWWNTNINSMVSIENNGDNSVNRYVTLGVIRNTNDAEAPQLGFAHSRGTTHNSKTVVQSGDSIGTITFQGADGTQYVEGARISAVVDGTAGANDMPTRLTFSVTHDGAATVTEKLRIDEHGLKFNGDTAEANALNDYEEGQHTITLVSANATLKSAYGKAKYTRIGRQVTVQFYVGIDTVSGSDFFIVNIPFASSANQTNENGSYASGVMNENVDSGVLFSFIPANSSEVRFYRNFETTAVWDQLRNSDLASNSAMYFSVTYFTDT